MTMSNLPVPVRHESRTCFGLLWFEFESDADQYGEAVRKGGGTVNGGFEDGQPCGRASQFDMDEPVLGFRIYAVRIP